MKNSDSGLQKDEALIKSYKASQDSRYMSMLFNRYVELVYGLCLKYLKDSSGAKDATMDIFSLLGDKLLKHEIANFRAWMYSLSRNHCFEILRKNKNLTKDLGPELMYLGEEYHPFTENKKENQLNQLEKCVEQLTEEQKRGISLFYLESKSYEEISAQTGWEWSKVRSQIQNGRRNLKKCMERLE